MALILVVTVPYVFMKWCVKPFRLPTDTMAPTLLSHDCVVVEKLTYKWRQPQRGEVIVFRTDSIPAIGRSMYYIKRVVGIPGDKIRIDPPNLIVNEHPLKDPAIFARISSCKDGYSGFMLASSRESGAILTTLTNEVVLHQEEFFVLGDNTKSSFDSRYWGPVPRENIVGRVIGIYWPPNRIKRNK